MGYKCRLCGKGIDELRGAYLTRVNEKGVPGIWECKPMCGADLPQETLLVMAIESDDKAELSTSYPQENSMTEAEQNRSAAFTLALIIGLVLCIFSATIGGIVIALAVGYLIVAGAAEDIVARLEVSRRSIDG